MRTLRRTSWSMRLVKWGSAISLLLIALQATLSVGQIKCTLSSGETCPDHFLETLSQIKGQPLLFNNLEQKINQLEFSHPVQSQVVSKKLPKTLTLILIQEPELYQVKDTEYSVTKSGFIFETSNQETVIINLPKTVFDQKLLDHSVHQTLVSLLENLATYQVEAKTVEWRSSEEILLKLSNGLEVITNSSSTKVTGQKLELVLSSEPLNNLDLKSKQLDLRFKLPVLRNVT